MGLATRALALQSAETPLSASSDVHLHRLPDLRRPPANRCSLCKLVFACPCGASEGSACSDAPTFPQLSSTFADFAPLPPIISLASPPPRDPAFPMPVRCIVIAVRPRLCTRAGTPLYILSCARGRIERTARVSLRPSRRDGWLRVKISVAETVLTWNACPLLLAPARWPRLNKDAGHIPADHACLRVGRVSAC